jgi:hypothetical protein
MRDRNEDFKVHESLAPSEVVGQVHDSQVQQRGVSREGAALQELSANVGKMSKDDLGRASEQLADSPLDLTKMANQLKTCNLSEEEQERLGKMVKRAQSLMVQLPCAYHY